MSDDNRQDTTVKKRTKTKRSNEVERLQFFKEPSIMITMDTSGLTLVHLKTYSALINHYQKQKTNLVENEISLRDLTNESGYRKKDIKYLVVHVEMLTKIAVAFNQLKKSKKSYGRYTQILSGADFDSKPGFLIYQFSEIIKRSLTSDIYAITNLNIIINFETKAALCLYKNGNDYKKVKTTPIYSLDILKSILGCKPHEYTNFKDLRKRIIAPACKEVREKSDLEILPVFFKGKYGKVHSVKFHINEKESPLVLKKDKKLLSHIATVKKKIGPYSNASQSELEEKLDQLRRRQDITAAILKQINDIKHELKARS